MAKVALSFRLTLETLEQARIIREAYHYKNVSELYATILTEYASYQVTGGITMPVGKRFNFGVETLPQAARVNPLVYRVIKDKCAPAINNTSSIWCALVIGKALKDAHVELKHKQRQDWWINWAEKQADRHKAIAKDCLKDLLRLPVT